MTGVILNAIALHKVMKHGGYEMKKSHFIIFLATSIVCAVITLSYITVSGMVYNVPYILCAFWLLGVAYVDYITCNVYEIMEYYAIVPVILSIVKLLYCDMPHAVSELIIMLATVIVYYIMAKKGLFGEGDSDVLSVVCVVYSKAYYNCIFFVLVMYLFLARNFVHIIKNRGRLGGVKPLIPSIYMGYVIMLPFVA